MKKIVFVTGTRADYGKLKSLIRAVDEHPMFDLYIYATGMHALRSYGYTADEIFKDEFEAKITVATNQSIGESMDSILSNTVTNFSQYIEDLRPDLIVIHGDRVESLAAAIVGAFRNTLLIHIEGGEVSGTIDESIRHAISKFAHVHLVANETTRKRIIQLGEDKKRVFAIGSPDIDVMLSDSLLGIDFVKNYYQIPFESYSIVLYHPVTTDSRHNLNLNANALVDALLNSNKNYVVIYPNNDYGCDIIFNAYNKLKNVDRMRMFPSLRFEYFLVLLKNCDFIIGNSSSLIREAPVYAVPSINLGNRQAGRYDSDSIINCEESYDEIISAINKASKPHQLTKDLFWGDGNSAEKFIKILTSGALENILLQKKFVDLIDEQVL